MSLPEPRSDMSIEAIHDFATSPLRFKSGPLGISVEDGRDDGFSFTLPTLFAIVALVNGAARIFSIMVDSHSREQLHQRAIDHQVKNVEHALIERATLPRGVAIVH